MSKIKDAITDDYGNIHTERLGMDNKQAHVEEEADFPQWIKDQRADEVRNMNNKQTDTVEEPEVTALDYAKVVGKKLWQHRADIGLAVIGLALFDLADTVELTRDISAATLLEVRPDLKV